VRQSVAGDCGEAVASSATPDRLDLDGMPLPRARRGAGKSGKLKRRLDRFTVAGEPGRHRCTHTFSLLLPWLRPPEHSLRQSLLARSPPVPTRFAPFTRPKAGHPAVISRLASNARPTSPALAVSASKTRPIVRLQQRLRRAANIRPDDRSDDVVWLSLRYRDRNVILMPHTAIGARANALHDVETLCVNLWPGITKQSPK
jgi:hypothetical protein